MTRHFTSLMETGADETAALVESARAFKRSPPKNRPLAGKSVAFCFMNPSLRTQVSCEVAAAAQEERFTRKKHDPGFPANALAYVMAESGLRLSDLSAVAFYDKPYLKFERLLETYHGFAPRGLRSFIAAMPVWIKEKLMMRTMLKEELAKAGEGDPLVLFP